MAVSRRNMKCLCNQRKISLMRSIKTRFDVVLLGIDKAGQWHVNDAENYLQNADDPAHIALRPSAISLAQVPGKHQHQLINAQNGQPLPTVDVIFPIVHGTLGEDGSLQGCCASQTYRLSVQTC
ncbi:D-alanyl-alanine synthetase A [Salmonella enterica subsp. enterica]|nr:D-alanyl-alanine synthetase A [Salmonella enterica subsp. enterica]